MLKEINISTIYIKKYYKRFWSMWLFLNTRLICDSLAFNRVNKLVKLLKITDRKIKTARNCTYGPPLGKRLSMALGRVAINNPFVFLTFKTTFDLLYTGLFKCSADFQSFERFTSKEKQGHGLPHCAQEVMSINSSNSSSAVYFRYQCKICTK